MAKDRCAICGVESFHWNRSNTCLKCSRLIVEKINQPAMSCVAKAKKLGIIPKIGKNTKCTDCGCRASVYDHRDYFKPLNVEPVCYTCNYKRGHAKNRENIKDAHIYLSLEARNKAINEYAEQICKREAK